MATKRKPSKRKPTKRPTKRRAPRHEDDILADELIRTEKRERTSPSWIRYIAELRRRGVKSIGAKQVREMMIREGADPNSTEASQMICEMREE